MIDTAPVIISVIVIIALVLGPKLAKRLNKRRRSSDELSHRIDLGVPDD